LKSVRIKDVLILDHYKNNLFASEHFLERLVTYVLRQILDGKIVDGGLEAKAGKLPPQNNRDYED
jgi:hypothetical protein